MTYKEIPVELIDPNPWQTRREYDEDALVSLMASAIDELGIRQVPLVRPNKGRYQIAFGHGRFAAWKALGKKTIMSRVEELTDSQMRKELLIENVNRSDLDEDERFQALEQYREDLELEIGDHGFARKLSKETGIPETTLKNIYDVQSIRQLLKVSGPTLEEEPTADVILRTVGLPDEERLKLVVKAESMGWSGRTTLQVKAALKEMEPEIRALILQEEWRLPHKVIAAIGEMKDADTQKAVIDYIQMHKLNEELALDLIEQAKKGPLILEVKRVDEIETVFNRFNRVYELVTSLGYNEYKILGGRWSDATDILIKIRDKIDELLRAKYE